MNTSETRLLKPADAIKLRRVSQKPFLPAALLRAVGLEEQKLHSGVGVRYLYQLIELEEGRRRATDTVWFLDLYRIRRSVIKPDEPVLY